MRVWKPKIQWNTYTWHFKSSCMHFLLKCTFSSCCVPEGDFKQFYCKLLKSLLINRYSCEGFSILFVMTWRNNNVQIIIHNNSKCWCNCATKKLNNSRTYCMHYVYNRWCCCIILLRICKNWSFTFHMRMTYFLYM